MHAWQHGSRTTILLYIHHRGLDTGMLAIEDRVVWPCRAMKGTGEGRPFTPLCPLLEETRRDEAIMLVAPLD